VSKKSHVCDDCIDLPLGMFTLSGVCAACLLVHGAVADITIILHPENKTLCHPLLLLKLMGYSLKLIQIDLTYDI
jgi:hypothetical protein